MKIFIGTGADGLKPEGYTTVDIDAANKPDIVADASKLPMIESGTAEEVYASHVVEHIPWPYIVSAIAEWARVLQVGGKIRISVPDMAVLANLLSRGENAWHVMANIYGGHWATPGGPQGHHFGYTWNMLVDLLTVAGFGDFDHWNTFFREAANGWLYAENGERIGLSINIEGTKKSEPMVDIPQLVDHLRHRHIMQPLMMVIREIISESTDVPVIENPDPQLIQLLHFKLIEQRIRNRDLEARLAEAERQAAPSAISQRAAGIILRSLRE
jgi:predicted SAM-dependent methyltransferase